LLSQPQRILIETKKDISSSSSSSSETSSEESKNENKNKYIFHFYFVNSLFDVDAGIVIYNFDLVYSFIIFYLLLLLLLLFNPNSFFFFNFIKYMKYLGSTRSP
jgi:hypothetical protein